MRILSSAQPVLILRCKKLCDKYNEPIKPVVSVALSWITNPPIGDALVSN